MALLPTNPPGELLMVNDPYRKTSSTYNLLHTISYCAQTPWLQHQSIRDNIVFGSPYEEDRYKEVVECCALEPDLRVLEDGDLTEIGVRGVSLSGGQKARCVCFVAKMCVCS
jgi:ABC-type transport system involved in cytochrome bd biosynthesis fused ATPase/permease subunit